LIPRPQTSSIPGSRSAASHERKPRPAAAIGHPDRGAVTLEVNGAERQSGDLCQLIWKVPEIISYLSGLFSLAAGDLIYTGTPSGVGPVARGDRLAGRVEGVGEIEVEVV